MILEIALHDNPILRRKAAPVTQFDQTLKSFVDDLVETLIAHKGWGLAAPQVCCPQMIFAMSVTEEEEMNPLDYLHVFINPEIISVSKKMTLDEEGCLSIPEVLVPVLRPYSIKVKGQNLQGETQVFTFEGYEARCFLHEYDHLQGILITDYAALTPN